MKDLTCSTTDSQTSFCPLNFCQGCVSKVAFEIKTMEFGFMFNTINTKEIRNKVRKKAILLKWS